MTTARPHTPAPEQHPGCIVMNADQLKVYDARVARAATLKTLDSIIEVRNSCSKVCDVQTAWEKEGLHIVFLRQQADTTTDHAGRKWIKRTESTEQFPEQP